MPVTAEVVVERARDVQQFPALHAHLWAVAEADLAQEARVGRAHRLLITLKVTIPETGESTRMMVHAQGMQGYQSLSSFTQKPDLMRVKLKQLADDISRARSRLAGFRSAIPDDVADEIDAALATAEERASPKKSASETWSGQYGMGGILPGR
jgi:hypothetical protein